MSLTQQLACACGEVQLIVEKTPIVSVDCCCDSCRAAGLRLERLAGARPVLDPHGGTRFVLYRKDRVRFIAGFERMKEFRLSSGAGTRRVVAGCCNTPVFLELEAGHWLSLYGGLWPAGTLPPLQMRTMTGDLADASILPGNVPNSERHSLPFFAKLLKAWICMGFRNPKIAIKEEIDVPG
ncbi:GFA family protein [Marilutibacter alkalisoli]|uniref:CENP-V/GFA domain-containing protein n=1 Tax=Marilutibacter alkalisoli TaxID=2591633 RepID=A0A514BSD6_9GAMM|nr:hypothetical protein [Lysobacter alkalisoli]QDH70312.1 hypothetical protein FKV23_09580 [Lysobacter alkalisoli]